MLIITQTALELGFLYALVAMALFLSYRILDIADMTTDGCFVLGAAVSVSLTAAGHPILAIPAAMLAGACAGFATAFLQTRLGVPSILAGIVTNTGLYTVNLMAMGWKANQSLLGGSTIFTLLRDTGIGGDWYELLLAAAVGMFFGVRWWIRTSRGRYLWARTLLTLPLVGKVVQMSIMARFAAIFSILQRSGVSILDSLDILSETINNAALEREFSTIKEKLRSGQGIAEPLSTARYFTPLTINMVAVGEGAGNLETMLEDLAAHYDEEVEYAVGEMTEAIGPILIVVLAAVVGFFALAIFMPMWDMTKLASGGR